MFIDPDPDTLITTNTNAGTTLKQVAFDKSVQRHLGSTLYLDRVERFRTETGHKEDELGFSERDLVTYFRGQSREMKRYILDAVRDGVTSAPENRLRDFIDYGGRGKERPLSYSSIDKTFYSFFVYQEVLKPLLVVSSVRDREEPARRSSHAAAHQLGRDDQVDNRLMGPLILSRLHRRHRNQA